MDDETSLENLYELDFNNIASKVGELGKAALGGLKNAGAHAVDQAVYAAKTKVADTFGHASGDIHWNAAFLLKEWTKYCQEHRVDPRAPTFEMVSQFLEQRMHLKGVGKNFQQFINKQNPAAPTQTGPAKPVSPEVQADIDKQRQMGQRSGAAHELANDERERLDRHVNGLGDMRNQTRPTSAAAAQQSQAFNKIMGELKKSSPNRNAVYKLTTAIIDHAKKEGGPEKERAKAFLKHLKKPQNLSKVPNLSNLTLESAQRVIDFAIALVEAETLDREIIAENYQRVFEATPMSMDQLKTLFGNIAQEMVIQNNNQKYARDGGAGGNGNGNGNGGNGGGNGAGGQPAQGKPEAKPAEKAQRSGSTNLITTVNTIQLYHDLYRATGQGEEYFQQLHRELKDKPAEEAATMIRQAMPNEHMLSLAMAIYIKAFTANA